MINNKLKKDNNALNKAFFLIFLMMFSLIIPALLFDNIYLIFSFFILIFSVLFHLWKSVTSKYFSVSNIFLNIFYIHFFLIAPLIQFSYSKDRLVNTFPVQDDLILYSNLLLSSFIFITTIVYFNSPKIKNSFLETKNVDLKLNNFLLKFLFIISVFLLLPGFISDILERINIQNIIKNDSPNSTILNLIWSKSLKIIPLYFLMAFTFSKNIKMRFFWQFFALLMVITAKNPIVEHRNGFGASFAVAFFLLAAPYIRNLKKTYVFGLLSFPIVFALGVFLAPHRYKQNSFIEEVLFSYNSTHFDAWSNLCAGIVYINEKGFYFGKQLFSAIFFWVPRSVWTNKGSGTGQELGDYLMQTEQLWFNNISSILPLEAYVDFGIIGVIVFAICFGKILVMSDRYTHSLSFPLKPVGLFISCSILFLYRGPFLSSFAFTFGGIIGILFIHYLLKYLNLLLKSFSIK